MSGQQHKLALPKGTVLQQYQIESVLGVGGFGMVYKAKHKELEKLVAIKEYLPQHCATRDGATVSPLSGNEEQAFEEGIEKFLEEAKQLVKFDDHPNIIRCTDFFRANGTAYLVMKLEVGNELADLLKKHTSNNKPLTEQQIINIVTPILEGLKYIHSEGVLHRDIKPANIFVRKKDSVPLLIDFGAAKQDFGNTDKTEHQMQTKGYAPTEQATDAGELGPWTDIHAVGAMMWRIIANENPPESTVRQYKVHRGETDPIIAKLETLTGQYSLSFLNAIAKATALNHEDRFQDADGFIQAISNSIDAGVTEIYKPSELDAGPTEIHNPNELGSGAAVIGSIGGSTEGISVGGKSSAASSGSGSMTSGSQVGSTGGNTNETSDNSTSTFPTTKVGIGVAFLAIIGIAAYFIEFDQSGGKSSDPIIEPVYEPTVDQFEFDKDVESVFRLIDESERASDDNGNKIILAINLCNSGSLDNMTKKMISDSKSSVARKQSAIEDNMINARRQSYSLVTQYQADTESVNQFMEQVISRAKQDGNYNKSELLSDYFRTIKAAAQFTTESEVKDYLKENVKVALHDISEICDISNTQVG